MVQYPIHGSKWFDVREYVDAKTFNALGVKAAWLVDPRIVRVCDLIREKSGLPVTLNNWHFRKPGQSLYDSSGFRAVWDNTGGKLSQHRCGRAADVKVQGWTPAQTQKLILDNKDEFMAAGLTTMENIAFTPTWLHVDCRPILVGVTPDDGFLVVDPV